MASLRNARNFVATRDMTLSESTGMLIDAAVERAKRELQSRGQAEREADREEIRSLRLLVEQRQLETTMQRRRVHALVALLICSGGLAAGWLIGHSLWSQTHHAAEYSSRE